MFCLWNPESSALENQEYSSRNSESINYWNQESKFPLTKSEMHYLGSGIDSVKSGIQAGLSGTLTWSKLTILSNEVETFVEHT